MTDPQLVGLAIGSAIGSGALAGLFWMAYQIGEHSGYQRGLDEVKRMFGGGKR